MCSSDLTPLPPTTRVGAVGLSVADLERSIGYYGSAIGLDLLAREDGVARMGAGGETLVELVEEPGTVPAPTTSGLFHLALLVPTRRDLANWLQHAIDARVPIDGMADHVVSEALYLTDPDGHGIEVYADRDRATWEGRVAELMGTFALDVPDLLAEADGGELPPETTMGHVHLRVRDIPETIAFHRDVVGWDLMMGFGPQAAFLSAGGYHHHIGANTWQSAGQRAGQPGEARLLYATIVSPDGGEDFEDPSGIRFRFAS